MTWQFNVDVRQKTIIKKTPKQNKKYCVAEEKGGFRKKGTSLTSLNVEGRIKLSVLSQRTVVLKEFHGQSPLQDQAKSKGKIHGFSCVAFNHKLISTSLEPGTQRGRKFDSITEN